MGKENNTPRNNSSVSPDGKRHHPSRRDLFKAIGAGVVAIPGVAVIEHTVFNKMFSDSSPDRPTPLPMPTADPKTEGPHTAQQNLDAIYNYLLDVGVTKDETEISLWKSVYSNAETSVPRDTKDLRVITEARTTAVETCMEDSHNSYFTHTIAFMQKLSETKQFALKFDRNLDAFNKNAFMATSTEITDGILKQVIHIDSEAAMQASSGIELGLALVHEETHVENRIKLLQSLPASVTNKERLEAVNNYIVKNRVADEASAYAVQSQAALESLRLGVNFSLSTDLINVTATYVRCNTDVTSPEWISFIARRLATYGP